MRYEPDHQLKKWLKQNEVIQRGEHSPKKCEFRTDYSHYISGFFTIVPKLDVHSFYENYSGDEFNQCHNQCHDDEHQNVMLDSARIKTKNVRFHKAQRKKRDRPESIDWQTRPCQKTRIEPKAFGIRFVEKSAKYQFDKPPQDSAEKKEKCDDYESLKSRKRIFHSYRIAYSPGKVKEFR